MKNLLLQIKNKKIDNLLDKDTYKLYKYLYDFKLDDPHIRTILAGINANECQNDLEKIILALFFTNKTKIENIHHRIFLQEYFPKFSVLIEDSKDIKYRLIFEYYKLEKGNSASSATLNNLFTDYIKISRTDLLSKKDIILKKDTVNSFLTYYNTKYKILQESDKSLLINFVCKYLSNQNIEDVYEILEDKSQINIEINNRDLFDKLKYKIIRETLINPMNLVNLKVEKKTFYLLLNKATMTYRELLDKNLQKYLEILKLIKYKKKYILLVEWLKTLIYFGRFDLFKKLLKKLTEKINNPVYEDKEHNNHVHKKQVNEDKVHKYKLSKDDLEPFLTLKRFLKDKNLINMSPFLVKCGYLKDSEFTIYSYRDIVERYS